jgi:HSP20 family molecular chaperone IbpA
MHCPDVPRDSLEVGVENGKLYLAGEGFRRCLSLPDDIDTTRVEAFYGEGILEIHLRKA